MRIQDYEKVEVANSCALYNISLIVVKKYELNCQMDLIEIIICVEIRTINNNIDIL